jgi:two-component system, NarL family, response regulator NreC
VLLPTSKTMPALPPESPPTPQPASSSVTYEQRISVILVSAHEGTRSVLDRLLREAEDIEVLAAYSYAQEARLEAGAVVLLDLSGDNTIDTVSYLASIDAQIPLLVIGNSGDESTALEVMRRKATGYILRNARAEELLNAVRQVHSGRRYLSSPFREQAIEYYVHTRPPVDLDNQFKNLTRREREILDWVVAGYTSAEIAERLSLSPRTVETHRTNLMRKLDVHSKWELIGYVNAANQVRK